jgi:carboxymethylenebutenolidase
MKVIRLLAGAVIIAGILAAARPHTQPLPADEHTSHMMAGDMAVPAPAGGTFQGALNLPASNSNAAARLNASPRHGEWVKVAWEPGSKDSLMAWIVYPSTTRAKSPVVVVVHEIFGLSTWVRSVADQVAAEGFIAIAPDLESRVRGGPSTVEMSSDSARRLIGGVDAAERNRGIAAVASYAMAQASAEKKYAVIGYCWGGTTVWMHAINGGVGGFSGGVAYYGSQPYSPTGAPVADSLAKIKVPVMLLNGAVDQRIGAAMPAVDSAMKALKKDYYGQNYAGAVHGFLRAQGDSAFVRDSTAPDGRRLNTVAMAANTEATKDAWPRTVAFLKQNLGVR